MPLSIFHRVLFLHMLDPYMPDGSFKPFHFHGNQAIHHDTTCKPQPSEMIYSKQCSHWDLI